MPSLVVLPYALILAGAGLAFVGLLPAMVGWVVAALGVLSGVGVAIAALLGDPGDPGWVAGLAALPALVAVPKVLRDLSYPRLNDVSTDLEDPPAFVTGPAARTAPGAPPAGTCSGPHASAPEDMPAAALASGPAAAPRAPLAAAPSVDRDSAPAPASSATPHRGLPTTFPSRNGPLIRAAYPQVRSLLLAEPRAQVVQRVIDLAARQPGWTVTHQDPEAGVVQAEASTSVFRFVDDVVIRVGEQDGRTRVDLRSRSRDGLVDAGVNARRIQGFLTQLAAQANPDAAPDPLA